MPSPLAADSRCRAASQRGSRPTSFAFCASAAAARFSATASTRCAVDSGSPRHAHEHRAGSKGQSGEGGESRLLAEQTKTQTGVPQQIDHEFPTDTRPRAAPQQPRRPGSILLPMARASGREREPRRRSLLCPQCVLKQRPLQRLGADPEGQRGHAGSDLALYGGAGSRLPRRVSQGAEAARFEGTR
jgi:hypothetical protein